MTTTQERDKQIHTMRENGKTLQQIGNYFNLTRERIRQIVNQQKAISLSTGELDKSVAQE